MDGLFPSLKKIIYMIMQYDIKIPKKCLNQVKRVLVADVDGIKCHATALVFRFAGEMGGFDQNGFNS